MSSGNTRKRIREFLEAPFRPKKSGGSSPCPTSTTRPAFSSTPANIPGTTVEEDTEIEDVISGSIASADKWISSPNSQPLAISVPAKSEAFQKAIHEYIDKLSDDDKKAFQSATDVMEQVGGVLQQGKSLIAGSHTTRMEKVHKVFQCVKGFLVSVAICIQHDPKISSLVVGGLNCILTVSTCLRIS